MTEKEIQGFDRAMRAMLEDAEVSPSRRVWKAVSARVFDAPEPSSWRRWWWAMAAPVAAAAAALAVFIVPTPVRNCEEIRNCEARSDVATPTQPTPVLAEVIQPVRAGGVLEGQSPSAWNGGMTEGHAEEERSSDADNRRQTESNRACSDCRGEKEEKHDEGLTPVNMEPSPQQIATTPPESRNDADKQPVPEMTLTEFLAMGEPALASHPVEISMHGLLATNDGEFSVSRHTEFLAPGTSGYINPGITETGESSYGLPFTVGIGVRLQLTPRLYIATGFDYSLLSRKFDGLFADPEKGPAIIATAYRGHISHSMHYVGIPLNLYVEAFKSEKVSIYGYAGGEAEYCVANNYAINWSYTHYVHSDSNSEWTTLDRSGVVHYSEPVNSLQWSAGAGLGVQFAITPRFGVYLDPGVRYYFNCDQPGSLRTVHPLMFNMNAGLRFSL